MTGSIRGSNYTKQPLWLCSGRSCCIISSRYIRFESDSLFYRGREFISIIVQFEGAGGPVDHIRADLSGSEDRQDDSDGIRRVRVFNTL